MQRVTHRRRVGPAAALLAALSVGLSTCAADRSSDRPSILLFVMDTTRADAVSAYGAVVGTTPATDALARDGVRYTHAYAQAPWTLPSHATLFTGLLPSQHGIGWRHTRAPDSAVTLAERLRDAGYETVGFSENPWISEYFNMVQGFERFAVRGTSSDWITDGLSAWLAARNERRPFFLFVNVIDAHAPYEVRAENPYLPEGVGADTARSIPQHPAYYLCRQPRPDGQLAILAGLYRGDVAAADAKLAQVLARLEEAGERSNTIVIVTSDHGEHFGEHHLVSHQFSLREPLIHVPLVVHGLRGVPPAVIDAPVQLADIAPTALSWAGLPVPEELTGRPLPTLAYEAPAPRALVSEFYDPAKPLARSESERASDIRSKTERMRARCAPNWPVFGDMRTLIRYPLKLTWFERYPAEVHELPGDGDEKRDIASRRQQLAEELRAELEQIVAQSTGPAGDLEAEAELPAPIREGLEALGYLGD